MFYGQMKAQGIRCIIWHLCADTMCSWKYAGILGFVYLTVVAPL
jgi:hypothetical protein